MEHQLVDMTEFVYVFDPKHAYYASGGYHRRLADNVCSVCSAKAPRYPLITDWLTWLDSCPGAVKQ